MEYDPLRIFNFILHEYSMKQQNSVQYEMKSFYQTKYEVYSENINRIKVQSSRFILIMLIFNL